MIERITIFGDPATLSSDIDIAVEMDALRASEDMACEAEAQEAEDERFGRIGPKGKGIKIKL